MPAGASSSVLCTAGDTEVIDWFDFSLGGAAFADCSDVALGAGWIIDNCSAGGNDVSLVEGVSLQLLSRFN